MNNLAHHPEPWETERQTEPRHLYSAVDILVQNEPKRLYVRGANPDSAAAILSGTSDKVAIVGSRSSTSYGENVATDFACSLSEKGYTIVSGGAFGIDQAAHRGALVSPSRPEVPTIVVLSCGVDRPYPVAHQALFEAILGAGGLLVSEYPLGTVPSRERFLERNRIIAGLSAGVVVVEAAYRSGSLNTARHATEFGVPVMAVPGPITSTTSTGCHDLIASGKASLVYSTSQILNRLENH